MKYDRQQTPEQRNEWLKLEVTLGVNDGYVEEELHSFTKFLRNMAPEEREKFRSITGIGISDEHDYEVTDNKTLQIVMLKKFISSQPLSIIQESRKDIGNNEAAIYLSLLDELLNQSKYPVDIYVYANYRKRGTPTTWLNILDKYSVNEIEAIVDDHLPKIVRHINAKMDKTRRYVSSARINNLKIYVLSKPTSPRVYKGESRNIEVPGASYSLIILDLAEKKLGIVSGSKKEIQIVQNHLRMKAFKDALAPQRNEVKTDGEELLKKILAPADPGLLQLRSVDFSRTSLPESASLKVSIKDAGDLSEALNNLGDYWVNSNISDLKQAEFALPTGAKGTYKKVGLYTYGDVWKRTYINTATKNITSNFEEQFINTITTRIDGIDFKTTKFIINDLDSRFVIPILLRSKSFSTNPALPAEVEKIVVELTNKLLIVKQAATSKRVCWNCYATSWNQWKCPICDRDEMRIVSEAIKIEINEPGVINALKKATSPSSDLKISMITKQRGKLSKPLLSVFNPSKNLTTFCAILGNKKDIEYAKTLIEEGFGVIGLVDPKLDGLKDEIQGTGISIIDLEDALIWLLNEQDLTYLENAAHEQEDKMLKRIVDNANNSLTRLENKINYSEKLFEVDLKALIQFMVPDVIRLGTEFTGKSVPDGYCRYGSKGNRNKGSRRTLFGWDAKYSETARYRLGKRDTSKQKKYVDWLMNPQNEAARFGKLGIYGIIANFDDPKRMRTTLNELADYSKPVRIVLIEDALIVCITRWIQENWPAFIANNSAVADAVFDYFKRKTKEKITVSQKSDWPKLKKKLERAIADI